MLHFQDIVLHFASSLSEWDLPRTLVWPRITENMPPPSAPASLPFPPLSYFLPSLLSFPPVPFPNSSSCLAYICTDGKAGHHTHERRMAVSYLEAGERRIHEADEVRDEGHAPDQVERGSHEAEQAEEPTRAGAAVVGFHLLHVLCCRCCC